MNDTLSFDVGLAAKLKVAFMRNDWTEAMIDKACEGDILAQFGQVLLGHAEIRGLEHSAPTASFYPALNEVFTLSILKPFTGLEMVRMDCIRNWKEWQFHGTEITEPQTKRFKLVQIGYQSTFDDVEQELRKLGRIPQGQWRKAFKQAYPKHDGRGPVGVADASWVDPFGDVNFPCIDGVGLEYFRWTGHDFDGRWRWLVEAK